MFVWFFFLFLCFIPFLHFSSFSTSLWGFWTCSSGLSPAWFCTSYTLYCALNGGTTPCPWAWFSAATTMSFLNFCVTASCWVKPTPTLCPTAWGSSHSKGFSVRSHLQAEDIERTVGGLLKSIWHGALGVNAQTVKAFVFWYGSIFNAMFIKKLI